MVAVEECRQRSWSLYKVELDELDELDELNGAARWLLCAGKERRQNNWSLYMVSVWVDEVDERCSSSINNRGSAP
jgi:hypothetical protein